MLMLNDGGVHVYVHVCAGIAIVRAEDAQTPNGMVKRHKLSMFLKKVQRARQPGTRTVGRKTIDLRKKIV